MELGLVEKLKVRFVQSTPRLEELPENVVEIYLHFGTDGMDAAIVRRGYIASVDAVDAIIDRIRKLADDAVPDQRPFAERIGLSPDLSPDWCEFLDDLFQRDDSWAFFIQPVRALIPS